MQLWHVSLSSTNRLPLFSTEPRRRQAIRALATTAGQAMLLFSVVDEHIHLVIAGDQERTRRLRQAIHRKLSGMAEAPVAPSWVGPVRDRKHLLTLLRYHLGQVLHHKLRGAHPGLWSGSCFQDLVGARSIQGLQLQLGLVLPRQQLETLACAEVGLPGWGIRPVEVSTLRQIGLSRLKAAAASASAAEPDLGGASKPEVLARWATAHLSEAAQISKQEVCWALRLTRQGLAAALTGAPPHALMRATRIRLALEVEIERRYPGAAN